LSRDDVAAADTSRLDLPVNWLATGMWHLADTPDLALEAARADGCHVDEVVGTLSEDRQVWTPAPRPNPTKLTLAPPAWRLS
jgi:hypothetical protein